MIKEGIVSHNLKELHILYSILSSQPYQKYKYAIGHTCKKNVKIV